MKIVVCSAKSGSYTPRDVLDELAELVEESGSSRVWVSEHPVLADPP
jgi:alkanesulfonate monooxygenase SsuD/methylene tetrahydromethanopterin reductase-like flavin-dependent oxidoreductase (luciferase family)